MFSINFTGEVASKSKDTIQGNAIVSVSIPSNIDALKFDVELFSLPSNSDVGQEVTVNFHTNLNNDGVFYTDSNALEMQKRQLNYRPTWDLELYKGGVNVTANYYPVDSAIAIIDETTNMQMTVMNDRAQGGSVIQDGRIELMQNRRSNVDDSRGVNEALDEMGPNGYGISVPASYYVQIFNRLSRSSLQRQIQQIVDAPA